MFGSTLSTALAVGLFSLASTAQDTIYHHDGYVDNLEYGWSVQALSDLNGDGFNEFAAGGYRQGGYVEVVSGIDGTTMFELFDGGCYGMTIADLGDVNGDTVPDFAVGAPRAEGLVPDAGMIHVYSGLDGSELYNVPGWLANGRFALWIDAAGDLTGDGITDMLAGAIWDDTLAAKGGAAHIVSGADGSIGLGVYSNEEYALFGYGISGTEDLDDDLVPDLLIGGPRQYSAANPSPPGFAEVHSGADGALIHRFDGTVIGDRYGTSVEGLGDLNDNGYGDLLIGAPQHQEAGLVVGMVEVRDGLTGEIIRTHFGTENSGFGEAVRTLGDVDSDDVDDYIVGAPFAIAKSGPVSAGKGFAQVFSGATGAVLTTVTGEDGQKFAFCVAGGVGDLNNDRGADFIVGIPLAAANGPGTGAARVYSLETLVLSSDGHEIDIVDGGTQTLAIDFGVPDASDYLMLGTFAPGFPGTPVNGTMLPMQFDAYSFFVLAGSAPILGAVGTLDGNGQATVSVVIPPALPAELAGLSLHHLAVRLRENGKVQDVSGTTPLALVN